MQLWKQMYLCIIFPKFFNFEGIYVFLTLTICLIQEEKHIFLSSYSYKITQISSKTLIKDFMLAQIYIYIYIYLL